MRLIGSICSGLKSMLRFTNTLSFLNSANDLCLCSGLGRELFICLCCFMVPSSVLPGGLPSRRAFLTPPRRGRTSSLYKPNLWRDWIANYATWPYESDRDLMVTSFKLVGFTTYDSLVLTSVLNNKQSILLLLQHSLDIVVLSFLASNALWQRCSSRPMYWLLHT